MATTRLVIFDFDGVLANSEIISLGELRKSLAAFDIHLEESELVTRFLGASFADIVAFVKQRNGNGDEDAFREKWYGALFARYERELKLMPGARQLLDGLDAAGIRYCIASGGSVKRLGFALRVLDLAARFDKAAFSVDMVDAGKPAPDLFLHAAEAMQTDIADCLVIEDATAGAEAAERAGMRCIGFVGGDHLATRREEHARLLLERGVERIVHTLPEILDHL